MEGAETLAQASSATPRGRLRNSAPVNFGACRVAPLVTRFFAAFPRVEIELSLTDRYVDSVDEGFDAVFRVGPIGDGTLAARELASHRQVACASPAYLAAHPAPARPEDPAAHACLGCVNWSSLPYAEWRFTRDGEVVGVRGEDRRALAMVLAGAGATAARPRGPGRITRPPSSGLGRGAPGERVRAAASTPEPDGIAQLFAPMDTR